MAQQPSRIPHDSKLSYLFTYCYTGRQVSFYHASQILHFFFSLQIGRFEATQHQSKQSVSFFPTAIFKIQLSTLHIYINYLFVLDVMLCTRNRRQYRVNIAFIFRLICAFICQYNLTANISDVKNTFNITIQQVKVKVAQSCPTLCDSIDDTVHEVLQARILEWVAFPFSRGSS